MEPQLHPIKEKDIADDLFISKWPDWLRWGLMIPTALIGCFLFAWILRILMALADDGNSWRVWADIVQSAAIGAMFVAIAAYTAPRKQLVVAVVFLTVISILAGGLIAIGLVWNESGGDKLYTLLHGTLWIVGAGAATYTIKQELE